MMPARNWKAWLLYAVLFLWGLQGLGLVWHFQEEGRELARDLRHGQVGQAVRLVDPFWQWLADLEALMPPTAAYVFLDNYEAGKEIQARYRLTPRRHLLLPPEVPSSFLFYYLHRERASFLIVRDKTRPPGPGVLAAEAAPAFHSVALPGPGLVFRVDSALLWGEFYD
jgi:hypothetical protein